MTEAVAVSAQSRQPTWSEEHPGEPVVCFENVFLGFNGNSVLEDISFEVHSGETRILLGAGGCRQERAVEAGQRAHKA